MTSDEQHHDEPNGSLDLEGPERLWPSASERTPDHAPRRPGDEPARRVRRTTRGRRARLRRLQRRRSLVSKVGSVLIALGVAAVLVLLFDRLAGGGDDGADPGEPIAAQPEQDVQPTLVFATFDEANRNAGASLLIIAAHDRLSGTTTLVFVPTTTVADVPGHGPLPIGDAFAFGEGPLLDATLDNLLGLDLDHVVAVSEQGWSSLLTRVGGLTVDLPERLVDRAEDGSSQVRFRPGEQFLDGPRLAELLTFEQEGESQLSQLPRAQMVLIALLEALHDDPTKLDAVFADGAPMLDTTAPEAEVRLLFEQLVNAQAAGELVIRTLPVNPIGSGEEDTYRLDTARATSLIQDRFSSSIPVGSQDAGRRLQILNGNGAPGIGGQVAQLLLPHGFKVVLTGNADDFNYDETRIVVYADDEEHLAVAEEIRLLLGLGRVEFSRSPQSVVDVTIVVGRDFPTGG